MRSSKITGEIFKIVVTTNVHIQVVTKDYDGIMKEAYIIRDFHKNVYVKIPPHKRYKSNKAIIKRWNKDYRNSSCNSPSGLFAKAIAEYVAPYINRIDNMSLDGISATDM